MKTYLRRLDCAHAPTKPVVRAEKAKQAAARINPVPFLLKTSGLLCDNTSPRDLTKLLEDQDHIGENLASDIESHSPAVA
jgi:type I restriction enzyme M protein